MARAARRPGRPSPNADVAARSRPIAADQRVVGVRRPAPSGRRRPATTRASARRSAPARRSGRAGRGTGCRARAAAAASAARHRAARPRRPRTGRGRAPARAQQRRRDARSRGWRRRRCGTARSRGARIDAAILAVVVLPLVAETTAEPRGSRARQPLDRVGRRAAAAACRAASCRRRARVRARAPPPAGRAPTRPEQHRGARSDGQEQLGIDIGQPLLQAAPRLLLGAS